MNSSNAIRLETCGAEGDKLTAYQDKSGNWTIGRGSIYMPNGARVVQGNTITPAEDIALFDKSCDDRDKQLTALVGDSLPQNKFDSLWAFAYNEGIGNLQNSTLFKKVKADPNDITIPAEFMKWIYEKINGVPTIMGGLVIRRGREIASWLNCTLAEVATKWDLLKEWMIKENLS